MRVTQTFGFSIKRGGAGQEYYYWKSSPRQRRLGFGNKPLSRDKATAMAEAKAYHAEVEALIAANGGEGHAVYARIPEENRVEGSPRSRLIALREGTIAWIIEHHEQNMPNEKSPRMVWERKYKWQMLLDWGRDTLLAEVTPRDIDAFLAVVRAERGFTAERRALEGLRRLYRYGRDELGLALKNRTARIQIVKPEARVFPWPRGAVPLMVRAADALGFHSVGTLIIINDLLGQRPADVQNLLHELVADGDFTIYQRKTGAHVATTIRGADWVQQRIDEEFARQAARGVVRHAGMAVVLAEKNGKPWTACMFSQTFARIRFAVSGEKIGKLPPLPTDCGPRRQMEGESHAAFRARIVRAEKAYQARKLHNQRVRDRAALAAAGVPLVPDWEVDYQSKLLQDELAIRKGWRIRTTELLFRALRHTAALRMHQADCTNAEIIQQTGHTAEKTLTKYYLRTARHQKDKNPISKRIAYEKEHGLAPEAPAAGNVVALKKKEAA